VEVLNPEDQVVGGRNGAPRLPSARDDAGGDQIDDTLAFDDSGMAGACAIALKYSDGQRETLEGTESIRGNPAYARWVSKNILGQQSVPQAEDMRPCE